MFYAFPIAVVAANTSANKKEISMPISSGVIHQVDILFPDTCDHNIRVQIFDGDFQLWPSNRNGTIRGDAEIVSFRDFYEVGTSRNVLKASAWWEDTETAVTVFVQIGVLPKAVLQPFSLSELLRAIQNG